ALGMRFAFFFPAEDGIRDFHVTGVQTCALPISKMLEVSEELARKRDDFRVPLLDAAAISQAGHIPTVATSITRASINSVIQTARSEERRVGKQCKTTTAPHPSQQQGERLDPTQP